MDTGRPPPEESLNCGPFGCAAVAGALFGMVAIGFLGAFIGWLSLSDSGYFGDIAIFLMRLLLGAVCGVVSGAATGGVAGVSVYRYWRRRFSNRRCDKASRQ